MMALRRSGQRVRLGSCAAMALGVAALAAAGSPSAQAGVTLNRHAVVSWGANSTSAAEVPGTLGVIQVAAGGFHSLMLRSDGTVWAWGNNFFGQLGNGTNVSSSTPVQVPGLTGIVQVAAGGVHSLALRSDGTVWAWGYYGTGGSATPVQVPGLTGVTMLSAGDRFSLALRSNGTVWAWGVNNAGQLGNGTTTDSPVPVQVSGLSQVTGISAGFDSSLATRTRGITTIRSVWAWGGNGSGQLGDGTLTSHLVPEQVTGIDTPSIAGISAGYHFAVVLGADGAVWGWGADESGQLDNAQNSSPVTRPVRMTATATGITQIAAGFDHVLALRSNGTVLAWGDNSEGELGDGSTAGVTGAVPVAGLVNVSQVSAGVYFSLAIHVVPLTILPPQP